MCGIAGWVDFERDLPREAVRRRSTVALSGESADELFGGCSWFHDPEVLTAETFPWLTSTPGPFYDGTPLFDGDLHPTRPAGPTQ
ncbi:asparagine synthase-related protein [Streptomyces sp. ID05-04B]|uniref:asparagine synthase-related protein n=1 Tax=Streptomyces sp. ID05-04B TaxID=3028661 RepID=UPI0026BB0C92